jgi:mono/diheme cytochrome c family protein
MYAKQLTPYMRDKHPAGAGVQGLTDAQISDLSHYLHQQVDDTLRSGPYTKVINVLTGSAQAGEQYFDGAGGCTGCHSASGDLAHIADRYDAPTLQQRMLFPRVPAPGRRGVMAAEKPVTAKITTSDGETVSGTLVRMDDFNVALRDGNGVYHSWTRTPSLQVTLDDPYQAHHELLDKITDKEIHDLVAYLETLK